MRPRLLLVPVLVAVFACSDQTFTTSPNGLPSFDIADAARDYKSGFYWLPPMVRNPTVSGTFDATLSPTVEICELVDGACGPVLATYTMTSGPGGEVVRIQDNHYHVNWHTDAFALSTTSSYRISVRAGNGVLLGYADVQPAANGSGLKNLDNNEMMGLVDGRTLPIRFRIETGVVGDIDVEPAEVTLEPGGTQQYVATISDLHGNAMNADVVWSSSDESVAIVDQSGLATAIAEGTAIITATAEFVSGSATLTVEAPAPVVGSIEVGPLDVTLEPGGTQQYMAIVSDVNGNPMSADVTWSSSDESVAIVDQAGLVTAVSQGVAIITASVESVSGSATLTVEAPVEEGVVLASTGDSHSCAVDEAGVAFCWGVGSSGQLGNGFLINRFTPFPVAGGHTFIAIATAETHSCGITTTGQAYCWGLNNVGQLGDGTTINQASPSLVAGDLTFTSIVAGAFHTCALTASGEAYCWGFSMSGALGNGTTAVRTSPTPVSGNHIFASVTAGRSHTCGLTTSGETYCWGLNSSGQLGDGTTANQLIPSQVIGGLTFASISAGDAHTCALTLTGSAYCWGNADQGRLGMGDPGALVHTSPQSVAGGLTFTAITAGEAHSCGITTTGEAYCWGSNAGGRLGVGTMDLQSLVPAAVAGGLLFRSIDVGDHSCGVTTTNAVYCWGPGGSGRLGNGSTENQLAPTAIAAFPES
jgi:alpha-tubulin suppressor-like RCC1 family protein